MSSSNSGGSGSDQSPRVPLPRTVILLGWVSFFADVSGEMIYPLLPLFVVVVLNASATSLGWIEGSAQAVVAIMTGLTGWRSDRTVGGVRRRVPYIRWGYGLPVLGKAILALAVAWPMVLMGRNIDRIGKGMRSSPRDALIADSASPSQRGRAFGLHRAMDTAGAFVGVLLAAALLWWFGRASLAGGGAAAHDSAWSFRMVFGISAAMGLAALALTFLVRESPAAQKSEPAANSIDSPTSDPPNSTSGPLGLPRAYWLTVSVLLVFSLANSSDTFLLLRARDVGLEPWAVVLAYALFNLTYTAFSYPAGVLSDRIGRWRIIAAGWILYAVVYAGFALTNAGAVWPLMALYGVYMALTEGVGKALIADHAPKDRRGRAIGAYSMLSGLATLVSSVLAGVLWDRIGHQAPFWLGCAGAGVATVLVVVLGSLSRK